MARVVLANSTPGYGGVNTYQANYQGYGRANRLGGQLTQPSGTLVEQLGLPQGEGLVLHSILVDSAAAKAGLKNHDILLEFGGKKVPSNLTEFSKLLNSFKKDEAVDVVILRKGKRKR